MDFKCQRVKIFTKGQVTVKCSWQLILTGNNCIQMMFLTCVNINFSLFGKQNKGRDKEQFDKLKQALTKLTFHLAPPPFSFSTSTLFSSPLFYYRRWIGYLIS